SLSAARCLENHSIFTPLFQKKWSENALYFGKMELCRSIFEKWSENGVEMELSAFTLGGIGQCSWHHQNVGVVLEWKWSGNGVNLENGVVLEWF
ncbi:MAG: hypothetical protein ACKO96_41435, partial [Flammeovirgaceae bacterium]